MLIYLFQTPRIESLSLKENVDVAILITAQLSDLDEIITRLRALLRPPDGGPVANLESCCSNPDIHSQTHTHITILTFGGLTLAFCWVLLGLLSQRRTSDFTWTWFRPCLWILLGKKSEPARMSLHLPFFITLPQSHDAQHSAWRKRRHLHCKFGRLFIAPCWKPASFSPFSPSRCDLSTTRCPLSWDVTSSQSPRWRLIRLNEVAYPAHIPKRFLTSALMGQ